jgi:class 3 adenylate cyclase
VSPPVVEQVGDARAADVFARFDHVARASFARHGGREIDRTDGFLVLFERPAHALLTACDLHDAARSLSLSARAAVHFGEVVLRESWRGQVTVSWDGSQLAWLEWDGSNEVFLYERTPAEET